MMKIGNTDSDCVYAVSLKAYLQYVRYFL